MGRTVPSYRIALEEEISRWNGFQRVLRGQDKEIFREMMDAPRRYATEGGNAVNPIIFEPMAVSIMLSQQKRIKQLEQKIAQITQQASK